MVNSFECIDIDFDIAMDIEQLHNGGFYPLQSFMNLKELHSVLKKMKLPNGEIWSIPILFPVPISYDIKKKSKLILKIQNTKFATMNVSNIFEYDVEKLCKLTFGTCDVSHPGVKKISKLSGKFITGSICKKNEISKIIGLKSMNPKQVKKIIKKKSWKRIVGFHTRNPPHRAHEFLHKNALENHDGILIHPVLGTKKEGDFTREAIINSYEKYIKNYLPKENVIFTPLFTYSRYAGPREAVFTAMIRKNYGCTHFIVGRDHTGVKNFYGKYDSQEIFKKIPNLGIEILPYREPYYCKKCMQVTTSKTCPHGENNKIEISGTLIRKAILNKSKIPTIYIRNEVLRTLQSMKRIIQ